MSDLCRAGCEITQKKAVNNNVLPLFSFDTVIINSFHMSRPFRSRTLLCRSPICLARKTDFQASFVCLPLNRRLCAQTTRAAATRARNLIRFPYVILHHEAAPIALGALKPPHHNAFMPPVVIRRRHLYDLRILAHILIFLTKSINKKSVSLISATRRDPYSAVA